MSFSRAAMLFLGLTPAQTRAKGHAPLESTPRMPFSGTPYFYRTFAHPEYPVFRSKRV
jgi:hypothetical protein